jgi:aspartyl-tRNA(Asn)/glutamyl-tRNA(Gln) amidotransferase subunit A
MLSVLASHDPKDSTSYEKSADNFMDALIPDVKGMKIGIPRDYFGEGLDEDVKTSVLAAAETLKSLGAEVEEFDL